MHINLYKKLYILNTYKSSFLGGNLVPKNHSGIHTPSFESCSTGLIVYLFLDIHCVYY